MQSKSSKIQTRPIEDLLGRIRTLRQQGQREIRIPANEADKLADSLSQVMTRLVTIQEEIIEALKKSQEAQTINVEMDGGNFSKKE
jgi:aspartate/glutamate racemase